MPSDFTTPVEEGKIRSFKKFAMTCVRGMAICHDLPKDKPIPRVFKPNSSYKEELKKAKKNLAEFKKMSDKELRVLYKNAVDYKESRNIENLEEDAIKIDRYKKMLEQVRIWKPPTKLHKNFKKFMIDQIVGSMNYGRNIRTLKPMLYPMAPYEEWTADYLQRLEEDVEYYNSKVKLEERRCQEDNRWMSDLRKSLKEYPTRK